MTPRTLGEYVKSPWTPIGLFAFAALAGAFIHLNARIPCVAPQESPTTPIPYMISYANAENPGPYAPKDPMTLQLIRELARAGMADAEFQVGELGGSLHLRRADQVIHLPADAMVETFNALVTCADPNNCPITPTHTLSRGEATILIDDEGTVWLGNLETDDLDAFPFLACQKVKRLPMP